MFGLGNCRTYLDWNSAITFLLSRRRAVMDSTMKSTQLNHVALPVADVEKSSGFYRKFLKLEPIPRPAFKFPGAWFRLGEDQELHLIGNREEPVVGAKSSGNHWALLIDSMDEWEAFLQGEGVPYTERRTRPDGAFQIYISDPDRHCLELCTKPTGVGKRR